MAWLSNPSRVRRALVGASLIAIGMTARAEESPFLPPGTETMAEPEGQNALDRFEFRGVMTIGTETFVTLVDTAFSRSVIIPLGQTVESITVSDFRAADGTVQIESGGQSKRARLRDAMLVAIDVAQPEPAARPFETPSMGSGQMSGVDPNVAAPISDEEASSRMQRVKEEFIRRREKRRLALENQAQPGAMAAATPPPPPLEPFNTATSGRAAIRAEERTGANRVARTDRDSSTSRPLPTPLGGTIGHGGVPEIREDHASVQIEPLRETPIVAMAAPPSVPPPPSPGASSLAFAPMREANPTVTPLVAREEMAVRAPPVKEGLPERELVLEMLEIPAQPETPATMPPPREQAVANARPTAPREIRNEFGDRVIASAGERNNPARGADIPRAARPPQGEGAAPDVVSGQVRFDVLIAEVPLATNNARGLDAFNIKPADATNLLELNGIKLFGLAGDTGTSMAGTLRGYSITEFAYESAQAAIQADPNITLLSASDILTTHAQPASIVVGPAAPIIRPAINRTAGAGLTPIQNSNGEEIALTLDVTPVLDRGDLVGLDLKETIDELAGKVTVNGLDLPNIRRQEGSSYLGVKSGEIIVVGLQKNVVTKPGDRTAFSDEIPRIGDLPASRKPATTRHELLIFLRPVVVRDTTAPSENAREIADKLSRSQENAALLRYLTGVETEADKKAAEEAKSRSRDR